MVAVPKYGINGGFGAITCTVDSGKTATKGYFAGGEAGGVKNLAADGDLCLGVFANDATAGEKVTIYTCGVFTITAESGDDFYPGEDVYPTDDAKLIDGATGDYACGCAITDFASGGSGDFILSPSAIHFHTVHA